MNKFIDKDPDQSQPILQGDLEPGFFLFDGDMIPVDGVAAIGVELLRRERWGNASLWGVTVDYREGCSHGLECWQTNGELLWFKARQLRDQAIWNYTKAREELEKSASKRYVVQ